MKPKAVEFLDHEFLDHEFLEHINCGIFVIARAPSQLQFLEANSKCWQLLNCGDRPITTGISISELLSHESAQRLIANCKVVIENQQKVEYEDVFSAVNGNEVDKIAKNRAIAIHLSPVIDRGRVRQIIGTIYDRSPEAIPKILTRLDRDQFVNLDDNSDAVIVVDRDGVVRFVNRAAEILFNRKAIELEGEEFGLPIVTGERTEVDILRRDGQSTPAEMRVSETQGENEIVYIIASLKDITIQKLAKESLRLRDRALAASINGIVIVDAKQFDYPIIYVNPSFERITGYSAKEALGYNCRFLQSSDRDQEGVNTIRETLRTGQACYTILRNYRKDRTLFWVELWISPVYNEVGEITNFIGIQNDITSRFLDEQKRQESQEVLRTVLTAVKEGITFSDEQGRFIIFNQEMENLTGYSMAEANASESFVNLIHPQDRDLAASQIDRLRYSHLSVESEVKIQTKSGVIKNVLVFTSVVQHQGQIMYLSAYRDITERKEAEEKIRQTAERERLIGAIALRIRNSQSLTEILQNTVDEVREFLDSDRVLIYQFQEQFQEQFQGEFENLSESKILVDSVLHQSVGTFGKKINDDYFSHNYSEHPQGITVIDDVNAPDVDIDYAQFLKKFEVKANLVVPISDTDSVWGLLIAHQCRDIRVWTKDEITLLTGLAEQVAIGIRKAELLQTVQTLNSDLERQVEERTSKLRQALAKEKELGEMKSRFVSMASHEFRTPLAIIQAASDLLRHYNHKLSEPKRLEKLDKIQLEVKNMTELLEDVLTIGKIELRKLHLNRVQMDLEKFCQDSIEEFKSSINGSDRIEFIAQNRGGVKPANIFADPKLLRQVIINLMSNGIKYSIASPKELKVNLFYDATSFDLEFIDRGIGIPWADRDRIFESFHRGHNVGNISGTGLGLAIAQASIDLHKGKIMVSSQENIGTTMTITIPYQ